MHVIPRRYVLYIKSDLRPKERIFARRSRNVPGMEFKDRYAAVNSLFTLRPFTGPWNSLDLNCDRMDVVTALLHGNLEENTYMELPV